MALKPGDPALLIVAEPSSGRFELDGPRLSMSLFGVKNSHQIWETSEGIFDHEGAATADDPA
jgi:hypothetical protein